MPGVSELARQDAEVQSAAPLARATQIVLAGGAVPVSLLREVVDEDGPEAVLSLTRLAVQHRRG